MDTDSAALVDFFGGARKQMSLINAFAEERVLADIAKIDHLGYKCASSESFEEKRRMFESQSRFIYQSIISKRRIAIIGLAEPLPTTLGDIHLLELSDQKPDGSQKEGFDHAEILPKGISYEGLVQKLEEEGAGIKIVAHPNHTTYDISLASGFHLRLRPDQLIEKIKREEMV